MKPAKTFQFEPQGFVCLHSYFINSWQSKFGSVDIQSKLKANIEDRSWEANFDAVNLIYIEFLIVTQSKSEVTDYLNSLAEKDNERKWRVFQQYDLSNVEHFCPETHVI